MDALRALWNEIGTRMMRQEGDSRSAPAPKTEIDYKADALDLLVTDYQEKFRTAYDSSYPPYVHMIEHFAEMQRRRQSDISDYSGEVVEHYGKQGGEVAMRQTKGRCGIGLLTKSNFQKSHKTPPNDVYRMGLWWDLVGSSWKCPPCALAFPG